MPEEYATKLIPDFDLSRTDQWFQELLSVVSKKKPRWLQKYPNDKGGDLYTVGDRYNGYYYLQLNEEIVYFVRYRLINANGNQFGRQVLVARKRNNTHSTGVALHVFYDYLLPQFGSLITDTQQTGNGRAFWDYALAEAFRTGKHVYFLDRRSRPNALHELADESALEAVHSKIWGYDEGHLRTHAVISNKPLSVKVT